MIRTSLARFALASALAACTTDGGSTLGGDDDPPPPTGDHVPREGRWTYDEVTPLASTCPTELTQAQGAGTFQIDQASAASFRITPGDNTGPFTCALASGVFDCPNRAAGTEDLRPSADAVVTYHASAAGSFTSELRGAGTQRATVTCAGSQCGLIAAFPCEFEVRFVIRAL